MSRPMVSLALVLALLLPTAPAALAAPGGEEGCPAAAGGGCPAPADGAGVSLLQTSVKHEAREEITALREMFREEFRDLRSREEARERRQHAEEQKLRKELEELKGQVAKLGSCRRAAADDGEDSEEEENIWGPPGTLSPGQKIMLSLTQALADEHGGPKPTHEDPKGPAAAAKTPTVAPAVHEAHEAINALERTLKNSSSSSGGIAPPQAVLTGNPSEAEHADTNDLGADTEFSAAHQEIASALQMKKGIDMGKVLSDVLTKLKDDVLGDLTNEVKSLASMFSKIIDGKLGGLIKDMPQQLLEDIVKLLKGKLEMIQKSLGGDLVGKITDLKGTFEQKFKDALERLKGTLGKTIGDAVASTAGQAIQGLTQDLTGKITQSIGGMFGDSAAGQAAAGVVNNVASQATNAVQGAAGNALGSALGKLR